eukprot:tig00020909_g15332.t1
MAGPAAAGAKPPRKQSPLTKLYLIIYNLGMVGGWGYLLFIMAKHFSESKGEIGNLWKKIEMPLKIFQTGAVMEVLHAMFGVVRSPVFTTALQVASRVGLVWGITNISTAAQTSGFLALMVGSWSLVEVPRYLYYAWAIVAQVPYPLLWLRYSLFAILYPTGITGEVMSIWVSLETLQKFTKFDLVLPNAYNFSFCYYYAVLFALATYIPGSPTMYKHMAAQRKKYLGKPKTA